MIDNGDNIVEDLPFYGQEIWASHLYRGVIFISIGFKTSSKQHILKKDITVKDEGAFANIPMLDMVTPSKCLKFIFRH